MLSSTEVMSENRTEEQQPDKAGLQQDKVSLQLDKESLKQDKDMLQQDKDRYNQLIKVETEIYDQFYCRARQEKVAALQLSLGSSGLVGRVSEGGVDPTSGPPTPPPTPSAQHGDPWKQPA